MSETTKKKLGLDWMMDLRKGRKRIEMKEITKPMVLYL